jgi:hypothetical protein
MRKLERELKRTFPFAEVEITNGGHYRLRLPNGNSVVTPSTPGDQHFLRRARSHVRRQLQTNPEPHHEKV